MVKKTVYSVETDDGPYEVWRENNDVVMRDVNNDNEISLGVQGARELGQALVDAANEGVQN